MVTYDKLLSYIKAARYTLDIKTSTLIQYSDPKTGYWAVHIFDNKGNSIESHWGISQE